MMLRGNMRRKLSLYEEGRWWRGRERNVFMEKVAVNGRWVPQIPQIHSLVLSRVSSLLES
jgi:hypothetical protein